MKQLLILILLVFTACSSQSVYEVEGTKIHIIESKSFSGPNTTVVLHQKDGDVTPVYSTSSAGIGPALITGSAITTASYLYGANLESDEIKVSNSSNSSSESHPGRGNNK